MVSLTSYKKLAKPTHAKIEAESGFFLATVVITCMIIVAGVMALSTRTFTGLLGSIRQGQSRQAQQAAEAGMNTILAKLNTSYPYLLINQCDVGKDYNPSTDCEGWKKGNTANNLQLPTSVCSGTSPNPPSDLGTLITGSITDERNIPKAKYQLISYRYNGDTQQGGEALIRVKGEALAAGLNRSTTVIEQTVPILPKNCNVPINVPADKSSFAGLLASEQINMGNNDVTGNVNANVFCLSCNPANSQGQLLSDIRGNSGQTGNMLVAGTVYAGPIALPSVQGFPVTPATSFTPLRITSDYNLVAGSSNSGACTTTSDGVTHCLVKCINVSGNKSIKVWTKPGSGPASSNIVPQSANKGVRLYLNSTNTNVANDPLCGSAQVVNMTGQSTIFQAGYVAPASPNPAHLSIFGLPASTTGPSQTFNIGGGSSVSAFIYLPDGQFGINGSGGDYDEIIGAVWTRVYNGSSGNKINIKVPDNMGRILFEEFGVEYALGIREFAAIGANRWQIYQVPNS